MLNLQKPQSRAQERREKAKATLREFRRVRQAALERDGYRCRVCQRRGQVDAHHIQFRSAGGQTSMRNMAAMCRVCHDEIHAYRLAVHGDANEKLRIEWL